MSNNQKTLGGSPHGFTSAHFLLIAACLVLLLGFSVVKGSLTWQTLINLNPLHAAAETSKVLTYDQIKAQVDATYQASYTADDKTKEQLAEVDPTYGIGEVLGASTDTTIPNADDVLKPEQVSTIKVKTYATDNPKDWQDYSDKLKFVEDYYGASDLLQAFTTQDTEALKKAEPIYLSLIGELKAMPVPSQFEQYQQYKIMYYASLVDMARSYTSTDPSAGSSAGLLFFSLQDKVSNLQAQLSQQYGLSL